MDSTAWRSCILFLIHYNFPEFEEIAWSQGFGEIVRYILGSFDVWDCDGFIFDHFLDEEMASEDVFQFFVMS